MTDYLGKKGQGWLGGGVWGQGWLWARCRACVGRVKRKESSALREAHAKLQIKCSALELVFEMETMPAWVRPAVQATAAVKPGGTNTGGQPACSVE